MSQKVLHTPELVIHIGQFVSLWQSNSFHPKDLISCIKVCRLWRDAMTPLLWMVYDDKFSTIPESAVHANSQHIRSGMTTITPVLLKMTSLRCLSLCGSSFVRPDVLRSILDNNQCLESLTLDVFRVADPDFDDWRLYLSIKALCFQFYRIKPTWLFRLLEHCPNVKTLSMNEDPSYDSSPQWPTAPLLSMILQEFCKKVKVSKYLDT
ncbi:hypothetical protein BGZ94_010348 [Podila epigama]|nr:hypothetical protein BGZ94_010348 [Podila epigama]